MTKKRKQKKEKLTACQHEFMLAFQRAVLTAGGPVCVLEIAEELDKSDSMARAHLKNLMPIDYAQCVGSSGRRKRYVPGPRWLTERGITAEYFHSGGVCQTPGCQALAEVCYQEKYVCRDCMIGEKDDPFGRKRYYDSISAKSSAGFMADNSPDGLAGGEDDD